MQDFKNMARIVNHLRNLVYEMSANKKKKTPEENKLYEKVMNGLDSARFHLQKLMIMEFPDAEDIFYPEIVVKIDEEE